MTNREMIDLLKAGDNQAYNKLFNEYSNKLFYYALSLTGDYSFAKDIVQNAFIKTFECRKKLNPDYSIEGFLFKITYNMFVNSYHKNKLRLKIHDEYMKYLNQINSPENDTENYKSLNLVSESIEKLPKKCKKIFILSKKQGYSNKEISQILNLSIKTVEAQITIAFKKIKENFRLINELN